MTMFPSRLSSPPDRGTASLNSLAEGELLPVIRIPYTYDAPYRYQQQFKEDERAATDADARLWASDTNGSDTTQPAGG